MQCPGQDRRYWKGDAAFEVPCPECGFPVEIFKDEGKGRCSQCGHRFINPGSDFGCAKWCALAQECLGFAPERPTQAEGGEGALAGRLLQVVEQDCKDDRGRLARALRVFQYAKEFVLKEGGDPRVVVSAALLLQTDMGQSALADRCCDDANREGPGLANTLPLCRRVGLDEPTAERVGRIIEGLRLGQEIDSIEFRIVSDAERLATLVGESRSGDPSEWEGAMQAELRTEAARAKVRSLFHG